MSTIHRTSLEFSLSQWADENSIIAAFSLEELYCEWSSCLIKKQWFSELFSKEEWQELEFFDIQLQEAMSRHKKWPSNERFLKYKKGKEVVSSAKTLLGVLSLKEHSTD